MKPSKQKWLKMKPHTCLFCKVCCQRHRLQNASLNGPFVSVPCRAFLKVKSRSWKPHIPGQEKNVTVHIISQFTLRIENCKILPREAA